MTPHLKRRCWNPACPNWIELDPFDPEDAERHYCSRACEHRDMSSIQAVEQQDPSSALVDSIALALSRLREALAEPGRLSMALETRSAWRNRTRFLWIDCLTRKRGDLATVPDADAEALMQVLVTELNDWRSHAGRGKSRGRLDREEHPRTLAR